jgi:hypothetical protein
MPLRPDYTIFENYCKDCEWVIIELKLI